MTFRNAGKLVALVCVIVFCVLSVAAYYMNFIYPDSRTPHPSVMKSFLVETKGEAWLQKRIDEGKIKYRKLVQQRQETWDAKMLAFHRTFEACRLGNDAYRMKNTYECNYAWRELGGLGEFSPYMKMPNIYQKRKFVDLGNSEQSRERIIDEAILRDCRSAKTIRQARKIGCYY